MFKFSSSTYQYVKSNGENMDDEKAQKQHQATTVTIKIGHSKGTFTIKDLKVLPYFESLFSARWMERRKQNKSCSHETIDIFGGSKRQ